MALSHDAVIRLKTLGWALVLLLFVIGAPLLWAASPLLLAGVILVGALLGLSVHAARRLPHRAGRPPGWTHAFLIGAGLLTGLVAAPVWWLVLQPALHPLAVPRVTLSDGRRQVVFQGMVHVGSEQFYRSVAYDLLRAKDAGYVLFFEGVQPGTPEAEAWLDAATQSGGDLNAQYARIGEVCGLSFQGDFLAFVQRDEALDPVHLVTADVSVTEMYDEWRRLVAADPGLAEVLPADAGAGDRIFDMSSLLQLAAGLKDSQKDLLAAACKGVFSVVLGRAESPDALNRVILDFRNRRLAERIADLADADIYITYGSGHFAGLFRDLQAQDPAWRIVGTAWTTAILPPDDAAGRLRLDPP
ncbi:hypothetical protein [Cereibacter changlensis]|uniref:hypothetical protein n=1 Tax=Cereibacter changlensis TaxID=402884 RepID=UPI00200B9D13|nr:hypothetical protein [Cereibacter changlensis]